jgi:hypothetical protein
VTTTYPEAYDTITNHLIAYWDANAVAIITPVPELRFTGVEKGDIPKTHIARFTMSPVVERQASLRQQVPDGSKEQRYMSMGTIILQVFSPRSLTAAEELRELAQIGKKAFRGRSLAGCIWFRNMRINWLDPETSFLRANVVGEYEYDEIG